jgi:hypothetical protein
MPDNANLRTGEGLTSSCIARFQEFQIRLLQTSVVLPKSRLSLLGLAPRLMEDGGPPRVGTFLPRGEPYRLARCHALCVGSMPHLEVDRP